MFNYSTYESSGFAIFNDVAYINIGEVLVYCPKDPSGLWINCKVAETLNSRNTEKMREGYILGVLNSRGVHPIDPTGKPEKEIAIKFRQKAQEVENAGFQRFSVTLKKIADNYDREAERIILRFT